MGGHPAGCGHSLQERHRWPNSAARACAVGGNRARCRGGPDATCQSAAALTIQPVKWMRRGPRSAPEPLHKVRHGPFQCQGPFRTGRPYHVQVGSAVEPDDRALVHPLLSHTADPATQKSSEALVVSALLARTRRNQQLDTQVLWNGGAHESGHQHEPPSCDRSLCARMWSGVRAGCAHWNRCAHQMQTRFGAHIPRLGARAVRVCAPSPRFLCCCPLMPGPVPREVDRPLSSRAASPAPER